MKLDKDKLALENTLFRFETREELEDLYAIDKEEILERFGWWEWEFPACIDFLYAHWHSPADAEEHNVTILPSSALLISSSLITTVEEAILWCKAHPLARVHHGWDYIGAARDITKQGKENSILTFSILTGVDPITYEAIWTRITEMKVVL